MLEILAKAAPYLEAESSVKEGFDLVLTNNDLETTFKSLEGHIYGTAEEEKLTNGKTGGEEATTDEAGADATLADAPAEAPASEEARQDGNAEVTENTESGQVDDNKMATF